jgi:GNAT superfamily N-acetyltransferase
MRNAEHPQLWSLNQLYVDGPHPELTADRLTAELDRGLADARHRRAVVTDDATGRALADGMRHAGYSVGPLAVMLLDREPPEPEPGVAREIDEAQMRALEATLVAEDPDIPAIDRPVVLAGHAHVRGAAPGTRRFAGFRDGAGVCQTTLYAHDGVGQPEDVATRPAHRGHGIAAATVSLATREAVAAGCEQVFILCNVSDGPFPLYARLGFRAAGRFWTFNRQA